MGCKRYLAFDPALATANPDLHICLLLREGLTRSLQFPRWHDLCSDTAKMSGSDRSVV